MSDCICGEINKKYHRLTIIEVSHLRKNRQKIYKTICDCGNIRFNLLKDIKTGKVKSCGCLRKQILKNGREKNKKQFKPTHGKSGSKIYSIWKAMIDRCEKKQSCNYKNYGARGIKVCDRWKKFENFYLDVGEANGKQLDRIDNNGNYEPSNVRWSTKKEQANNRRTNKLITFKGQTKTLKQWCDLLEINENKIRTRIKRGWTTERAFQK